MHTIYLDLETRALAADLPGGWPELLGGAGGISIAVTIADSGETKYWDDHNVEALAFYLESADTVVTYNGTRFDLCIIAALAGRHLNLQRHYDLCREISGPRCSLDSLAKGTLGVGKNNDALLAPTLARQGKWAELVSYCHNDVILLQKLYHYAQEHGMIIDADGLERRVKIEQEVEEG